MSLASAASAAVVAAAAAAAAWRPLQSRVFGEDEALPSATLLYGVDCTGYAALAHPVVLRAADFAAVAHAGQFRRSGEPYVVHAVETARIVAGLVSGGERALPAIVAALLHDVVDDTSTTLAEIELSFGGEIAGIVDGVSKLSKLNERVRRFRRLEGGGLEGAASDDSLALRELILVLGAFLRASQRLAH